MRTVRWGILGTGMIARKLAQAINESSSALLHAVASRGATRAEAFAREFAAERHYGSYDALLADPLVDAVYISLPNQLHARWTILCAEAGKHILCEKPFTTNAAEAMVALEAVRRHDVFFMEAFMYRCHPQTRLVFDLIRDGAIGDVRMIQAAFAYNMGPHYDNIRLSNALSGGGIMDVGCYGLSMARLLAGAALGLDGPAEPVEIRGTAHIGEISRVDEWATGILRFDRGIQAQIACGTQIAMDNRVHLWGTKGNLEVTSPWFCNGKVIVRPAGSDEVVHEAPCDASLYANQLHVVADHLEAREVPAPAMTWQDTMSNMHALDTWRAQVGLQFDQETTIGLSQTIAHRPLSPRHDHNMTYGEIEGVGKPISRLVMGSMIFSPERQPFTCAMLDHFVELGGTCIDTAYIYMGGKSEPAIGNWIALRGNRDEVVIITKGAVPSPERCTPEWIDRHLRESLDRLKTDYVDIWMMHRDNPALPVSAFVDCLNEHLRAGRIRAYGASNWSLDRLAEANAYAAGHGLRGFDCNSPNLSLARWNEPIWEGCVSASAPEARAWHEERQMPLFAWSSQAQGFFTGRYSPDDTSNRDMVRCWYNQPNFERLERARQLAEEKGVTATQIAMAYVLCQPFPTFALIGPRTVEETYTSALGLNVKLTPDELAWLNLEDTSRG